MGPKGRVYSKTAPGSSRTEEHTPTDRHVPARGRPLGPRARSGVGRTKPLPTREGTDGKRNKKLGLRSSIENISDYSETSEVTGPDTGTNLF